MAPPNVDAMITLKVDNVPFNAASEDLKELFAKFGEVGDVYIPKSRASNESRGFAFIRFVNKEDAEKAIAGMEGYEHEGRQLHVQYAKQRRPENPREFYRERDRSRGDDRGRGYDDRGRGAYDDRGRGGYDRGYDDRGRGMDRGYDDRYRDDRYEDRGRGGGRYRSRSPDRRDYRERSRSRRRSRSPRAPREPRDHRAASPPPRRD